MTGKPEKRGRPGKLLFADDKGVVYDHPDLLAAVRSGDDRLAPVSGAVAMPAGGGLNMLPGRRPVGIDPETGELVVMEEARVGRRRFVPHAVGAVLPPGWTRSYLPATEMETVSQAQAGDGSVDGVARRNRAGGGGGGRGGVLRVVQEPPVLPQWAYTAAAWGPTGPVVWALHTDKRTHWSVRSHSTPDLPRKVKARLAREKNPLWRQIARCALEYRCYTAQNTFYGRDEGAIPASASCNAACVGCISEQDEGLPPPSHERMKVPPGAESMADLGAGHLLRANGRPMVSFGQGCEGEPLVRWREIAAAIRQIRARTARGSININTNGSIPQGLASLLDAGLDACRISLNSASPDLYAAYYRPVGYGFAEVEASMRLARRRGAYLALNLLTFPGVTDREGEIAALCELVARVGVDQVQTRPLAIDPDLYMGVARGKGAGGRALGIPALVAALRKARRGLVIGNFARARSERAARAAR
jgi:wyosine [tRNA(Phe)-imidazoG37] synthetase (radical SAM superfamily)